MLKGVAVGQEHRMCEYLAGDRTNTSVGWVHSQEQEFLRLGAGVLRPVVYITMCWLPTGAATLKQSGRPAREQPRLYWLQHQALRGPPAETSARERLPGLMEHCTFDNAGQLQPWSCRSLGPQPMAGHGAAGRPLPVHGEGIIRANGCVIADFRMVDCTGCRSKSSSPFNRISLQG